eukprot:COSAG01_NODE_7436_length_3212_cov_8.427241_2_plen_488_part_00
MSSSDKDRALASTVDDPEAGDDKPSGLGLGRTFSPKAEVLLELASQEAAVAAATVLATERVEREEQAAQQELEHLAAAVAVHIDTHTAQGGVGESAEGVAAASVVSPPAMAQPLVQPPRVTDGQNDDDDGDDGDDEEDDDGDDDDDAPLRRAQVLRAEIVAAEELERQLRQRAGQTREHRMALQQQLQQLLAAQLLAAEQSAVPTGDASAEHGDGRDQGANDTAQDDIDFSSGSDEESRGQEHLVRDEDGAGGEGEGSDETESAAGRSGDDAGGAMGDAAAMVSTPRAPPFEVEYVPQGRPSHAAQQLVQLILDSHGIHVRHQRTKMEVMSWGWSQIASWTMKESDCLVGFYVNATASGHQRNFVFRTPSPDMVLAIRHACDMEVQLLMSRRHAERHAERVRRAIVEQLTSYGDVGAAEAEAALGRCGGNFMEAALSLGIRFELGHEASAPVGLPNRCNDCFWLATTQALRHLPGFAKAVLDNGAEQ